MTVGGRDTSVNFNALPLEGEACREVPQQVTAELGGVAPVSLKMRHRSRIAWLH